jgi:rubrerythrin
LSTTDQIIEALREALDDEYKARATYRRVIEAFGSVQPFVNIVEAEERHIVALLSLFADFAVAPPEDTWPDRVTVPATLAEACRAGVQAEIENEAIYARLLPRISEPRVRMVMQRLRQASQERHLPAFQRCLERETGQGGGPGGPGGGRQRRGRGGHRER